MTKSKGKAQVFPYITLHTEQKEHIWHSYNNKAPVSVVSEW